MLITLRKDANVQRVRSALQGLGQWSQPLRDADRADGPTVLLR